MKHLAKYTIILTATLASILGFAQSTVETINLPSNGGSMIAGNKTFVHNAVANGMEVIDNNAFNHLNSIQTGFPVYQTAANPPEGYLGKIYMNASRQNTGGTGLLIYDVASGTSDSINLDLIDLTYSPSLNKVFGVADDSVTGFSDRIAKVYAIDESGSFNQITSYEGQISSLFFNPYDNMLYLQTKFDKYKFGDSQALLIQMDPLTNNSTGSDSLRNRSFYVDLDNNNDFKIYFNKLTTPYINPYNNKIYLPNGGHSNVSVVGFESNEPLSLTPGPNWISIPRMVNNQTTNYMEKDTIPDVFNRNRFAIPYSNLVLEYSNVLSTPAGPYKAEWKLGEWNFEPENPDNQNAFSYRGYTLLVDEDDSSSNVLYMQGQIKDPATTFPLYKDKKNWIGYFLVQEQDVFDALADHVDSITEIWHRNYYCYRPYGNEIIFGPEGGGVYPPGGPEWACTNSQHTIKYGEMIKVHPLCDFTGNSAFYWSTGNNTPPNDPRQSASYYSYTETASYKPIVIELDTTQNPQEIGAFVGDTCVGACSVIEADTAVILMAYLDGRSADSIVFREYSGAKSSGMKTISSYLVFNDERDLFEKRSISTREGNERVLVSFKNRKVEKVNKPELDFRIWPNPASDRLFYSFTLDEDTFVSITLFDITGKLMAEPLHDLMQAGSIHGEILLKAFSGEKLKPGIYLVKLRAGQWLETKKVIMK